MHYLLFGYAYICTEFSKISTSTDGLSTLRLNVKHGTLLKKSSHFNSD